MLLSQGVRSKCCYAPVRLGKKKIKNSKREVKIWVCCNCSKRDVDIVQYTKNATVHSTFAVDTEESELLE